MSKVGELFNVDNFQDLVNTSKDIHKKLKSLGCFKTVNMMVEVMPEAPTHYMVNISVLESGSLFANLGAVCGGENITAGVGRVGLQNVLGGGERAELELSKGWGGYSLVPDYNSYFALHNYFCRVT